MKRILSLVLALTLAGCAEKDNSAVIDQIRAHFDNARTLTGTVVRTEFGYEDNCGKSTYKNISRWESHGFLYVSPDENPTNILSFHYFSSAGALSEYIPCLDERNWEDADMFPEEIVSSNKPGTRITWKEGYRPFDKLIKVDQFDGPSGLLPKARYFSKDGKYKHPSL